jgi:predicted Zn-dependent protease
MLRRSLQVFVALSLVALAAVLGFAVLRLRGPEEMLREAQACFDRGEYARTVVVLEHGERSHSLSRDPSKQARLYRLRHAAHLQLDNAPKALEDLDRLLAITGTSDPELRLEHIRLLAVVGRGADALAEAKALLAVEPRNGRAMELAGEALQSVYRDELAAAFAAIDRDLGVGRSAASRTNLLAYLYRPDPDPEVAAGLAALAKAYAARPAIAANWPALQRRLPPLREQVQTSQRWFRDALEQPGEPVAALRGLAWSLDQAARYDDLFALCESYRRRFDHRYVYDAGVASAWAMVRLGAPEGALAASLRWLPAGSVTKTSDPKRFPQDIGDLLLARFAAARTLGEPKALDQLASDVRALEQIGVPTGPVNAAVHGTLQGLRKQAAQAEPNLRWALYQLLRGPVPLGQLDLVPSLAELRVQVLAESGGSEADQLGVFAEWQRGRPGETQPLRALAAFQVQRGRGGAALAALDEAAALVSEDEATFLLRVQAADLVLREAGQDGPGLLAQCLQRQTVTPEVADPLGFVLCAQTAVAQGVAPVALEAARRAAERFPERALPRRLEARALLVAGRPADAVTRLRSLLAADPNDAATAAVLLQALRAAGQATAPALPQLLTVLPPGPVVTVELLRAALTDEAAHAVALVPQPLPPLDAAPELHLLAAHATALAGDTARAHQLLAGLAQRLPSLPGALRTDYAAALAAALCVGAAEPDTGLVRRARAGLLPAQPLPEPAAEHLFRAAARLAAERPETAYALAAAGLACAAPEARTGARHALAGRLALRLGELQLAREHCTAAVAFADGREAASALIVLELALGRPERATAAHRSLGAPEGAALALRLQDPARAVALASAAAAADGGDLLAQVVLRLAGAKSLITDLPAGPADAPPSLVELAALLEQPGTGRAALPLAQALVTAFPGAATAQLLLARAHLEAGHPEAAVGLHAALAATGSGAPCLWREVALAATHPQHPGLPSDTVAMALAHAVARDQVGASPLVRAYAMQHTARHLAKAGNQTLADQLDADRWRQFHDVLTPTLADLTGLAARGRPRDAFWILVRRLATPSTAAPDLALRLAGRLAAELDAKGGDDSKGVRDAVRLLLTTHEPFGDLLHRIADDLGSLPEAVVRQQLTRHLELVAAGRDEARLLPQTLALLATRFGAGTAAQALDTAIAAHPTQIALWQARAELQCQRGEANTAVPTLRAAVRHAPLPTHVLDLCLLAAAHGAPTAEDLQAFAALPEWLLATARGRLAKGLLDLRAGRADAAVAALLGAEPRADGLHLQALALAHLQSQAADGRQRAASTFAKLAADYPSSSRARYAGSFARQLADR